MECWSNDKILVDTVICSCELIGWRRSSGLSFIETPQSRAAIRGRGASWSPANRFEKLHVDLNDVDVVDVDPETEERPRRGTQYFRDGTKSVITRNNSPDVGFETSLNPYRGCEHGCIYCYARPTHEYLGFSAGLDFESKIMVKTNAPELLRAELESPRWQPQTLVLSGVTDPYQPVERKLGITRGCLEVLARFRNPVAIITKNRLVTRDRRSFAQSRRAQRSGCKYFSNFAGLEFAASARAANVVPPSPPRCDPATSQRRNPNRRDGCTDHPWAHRS